MQPSRSAKFDGTSWLGCIVSSNQMLSAAARRDRGNEILVEPVLLVLAEAQTGVGNQCQLMFTMLNTIRIFRYLASLSVSMP